MAAERNVQRRLLLPCTFLIRIFTSAKLKIECTPNCNFLPALLLFVGNYNYISFDQDGWIQITNKNLRQDMQNAKSIKGTKNNQNELCKFEGILIYQSQVSWIFFSRGVCRSQCNERRLLQFELKL